MIDFYEERFKQGETDVDIDSLMSEEEQERVAYYLKEYDRLNKAMKERMENESGWENIHKAYKGERVDSPLYGGNTRTINVIQPQIEGQLSSMTNANLVGTYRGVGFSDERFASTAGIVGDFILDQNNIRQQVKTFGRRYLQFGMAVATVTWDKDAFNGMGLPKFIMPKTSKVLVDDKVDDVVMDLQSADYIIHEVGRISLDYARNEYGDDYADAIELGNSSDDFDEKIENEESFTMLRIWTKNNEKRELEMFEISSNGILLKPEKEYSKPFYKHVFNKYPFFFAGMYKDESDNYYLGDGYFLMPYQKYVNKLMDNVMRAIQFSSQGRTFFDPISALDIETFVESDPAKPISVKNPNANIRTERGQGINDVVFRYLELIMQEVYKTTRFSPLMTGNSTGETMTATQAGIQMQQGQSGIDDKKKDISQCFGDLLSYSIGMCMEFWDSATAIRVADNADRFEWIDVRQFKNIPEMIPADNEYKNQVKKNNPDAEVPEYMQLETKTEQPVINELGEQEVDEFTGEPINETISKPVTKELELDIKVNIGEGLPVNKIALYNIMLQLSQLPLFDEKTGMTRPLVGFEQFRIMISDTLGINIKADENDDAMLDQMQQQIDQMTGATGVPQNGFDGNQSFQTTNPSGSNIQMPGVI